MKEFIVILFILAAAPMILYCATCGASMHSYKGGK